VDAQYRADLKDGQEFQDFIAFKWAHVIGLPLCIYTSTKWQKEHGENPQGVEIKYDRRFRDTGNVFIETACRPSGTGQFFPGGIYSLGGNFFPQSSWLYVIGDYETTWTLPTSWLARLHAAGNYRFYEGATMKGYLFPVEGADKYCVRKDEW